MILRLFSRKYFPQYIALFLLLILLWMDVIIAPELIYKGSPCFEIDWLQNFTLRYPRVSIVLSILLLYLQALILNQVLENHRLTDRNQLLSAAIYILIMGSAPILIRPNIMIIVNFLMILLVNTIFNIYKRKEAYSLVFDTGFLIGLVSLLHFPSLFFILFLWMCFVIYQSLNWRDWMITVIGFLSPYLMYGSVLFLYDKLVMDTSVLFRQFVDIQPIEFEATLYVYIIWGLFTLLFLVSFNPFIRGLTERTIDVRKKYTVLIIFFLMTLLTVAYSGSDVKLHITLAAIPVSAFMTSYVSRTRMLFLSEIIITMILIVIFAGKLINLLQDAETVIF